MKPSINKILKTVFFIILVAFNKTEWLFITLAVALINICLYPNFIIDTNITRGWMRSKLLKSQRKNLSIDN